MRQKTARVRAVAPAATTTTATKGARAANAAAAAASPTRRASSAAPLSRSTRPRWNPGELYRAEPHLPGVTESVIVTRGRMRIGPIDAAVELAPGDRATFAADQLHSYEALTPRTQAILVLSYR
jgi:hypothetical protein